MKYVLHTTLRENFDLSSVRIVEIAPLFILFRVCNMKTLGRDLIMNNDTEKMVYDVEDIQRMLSLGRNSTYKFLNTVYKEQKTFRVLKFGKMLRVPKSSFDNWLIGKEA